MAAATARPSCFFLWSCRRSLIVFILSLLVLMLDRHSSSHQTLVLSHFFIRRIASHRHCISTGHYEEKKVISFFTSFFSFLFSGNILLMFLLYLKNLDGVALCLLCLLVNDLCLTIRTSLLPVTSFFFCFVRYIFRSPSPNYNFFYSFAFLYAYY